MNEEDCRKKARREVMTVSALVLEKNVALHLLKSCLFCGNFWLCLSKIHSLDFFSHCSAVAFLESPGTSARQQVQTL